MIVGTAGHIDHGKTALVKALTGVDADRLKEEKARGITIDLGYAYSDLGDGRQLGFGGLIGDGGAFGGVGSLHLCTGAVAVVHVVGHARDPTHIAAPMTATIPMIQAAMPSGAGPKPPRP